MKNKVFDDEHQGPNVGAVFVGSICRDRILNVPAFPDEDSKVRVLGSVQRTGGNVANASMVYASFANRKPSCMVVAMMPRDGPDVRKLLEPLERKGVDTSWVEYDSSTTRMPTSTVIATPTSRTILHDRQDLPYVTSLPSPLPRSVKWVHFEGYDPPTIIRIVSDLRSRGQNRITVSIELEKPQKARILELAHYADVLFLSQSFYKAYPSFTETLPPTVQATFITLGNQGGLLKLSNRNDLITLPALDIPPDRLKDTTGAGDAFIAAVIGGTVEKDMNWEEAGRFACIVSGSKCVLDGVSGLRRTVLRCLEHITNGSQGESMPQCAEIRISPTSSNGSPV